MSASLGPCPEKVCLQATNFLDVLSLQWCSYIYQKKSNDAFSYQYSACSSECLGGGGIYFAFLGANFVCVHILHFLEPLGHRKLFI